MAVLSLRGARMRQLRCDVYAALAQRWQWTLPVQRLRVVLQDEWSEQAAHQAQKKTGE